MLQEYYDIDLSFQSTLSLLNGILPVGGMLGAILVPNILPLTTKKYICLHLEKLYIF